jgi:5-methyltetrahydropteroyltriglutamate--homocysteine methyltransferase
MAGIRADHVGSLLTPEALQAARDDYVRGAIGPEELRAAEDEAVQDVLRLQRDAGVQVFTDGALRRASWVSGLARAAGLEAAAAAPQPGGCGRRVANDIGPAAELAVSRRLELRRRLTEGEGGFLGRHAPGPFKVAIPSPNMYLCLHRPGLSEPAYPTPRALLDDMVGICAGEVGALVDDGAAYVQLDAHVDNYLRLIGQATLEGRGWEADVADAVAADNAVLEPARVQGATTAVHVCRHGHGGARRPAGGYGPVAELLFGLSDADRLLLEFEPDEPDAFEVLRLVPRGKTVVLGLVATGCPRLEEKDALRRRIDEAAAFVEIEHLAISPRCGFAAPERPAPITEDDQKRKLELVAETARAVWG